MTRGRGNPWPASEGHNWSCCRSCGRLAHWGECATNPIELEIPDLKPSLEWGYRDLGFLPVEFVRPTAVSSWVVRVPGVEREFIITGEEYAIAAATGTAKTAKPVECEASQSGGKAASPHDPLQPPSSTLDMD